MKKPARIALCAALVFLFALPAAALTVPERLVYHVSWTGLKAATAVHELTARGDELHIVSTTRSSELLNPLFSIDDREQSVLTRGGVDRFAAPKYFRKNIHQGKYRALKEARFDTQKLTVESRDLLKKTGKIDPISTRTFDSLSSVYYVRSLELVPGKSVFVDIYDCKRLWSAEVKVLRREEVRTPLGTFKAIVVKPLLKAEGLFPRSGDMTVWLTDDTLRIPVMMTTRVKIGKISAVLVGGSYWPVATP